MARPPVDRSKPVTYTPAPPPAPGTNPEALTRAVWEEFNRIAQYLSSLDPAALALALERRSRRP